MVALVIAFLLWLFNRKGKPTQAAQNTSQSPNTTVTHKIISQTDPVRAVAMGPAIQMFVDGQYYWTAPKGAHVEEDSSGLYWAVQDTPERTGPQMVPSQGSVLGWENFDPNYNPDLMAASGSQSGAGALGSGQPYIAAPATTTVNGQQMPVAGVPGDPGLPDIAFYDQNAEVA